MAVPRLLGYEKERCLHADKDKKELDPLEIEFRTDPFAWARDKFAEYGISKKQLIRWQKHYPFLYAWNIAYEVYRTNVNRKFVVFPAIIAMSESMEDTIKAFEIARRYRIPFSIRAGAHCMENFSLSEGIIIDQSRRKKVQISKSRQQVTVEPGVLLGPLIKQLHQKGFVLPTGTCPNVGAFGLALGGGVGFGVRQFGATCDSIVEATVLLDNPDYDPKNKDDKAYKLVKADANHHSDLFWALKGAGCGNFGIVTSLTFNIYPLRRVILYVILFPFEQLEDSLNCWQYWAPQTDPEMNSEYRFNNGRQQPKISGLYFGSKERALELLEPFKQFCPTSFSVQEVEYPDAAREFAGKGRWLPASKAKNGFVSEYLPRAALKIVSKFMACGSGQSVFELNALGAKFNQPKPWETAFVHRTSLYWFLINSHWSGDLAGSSELDWANNFYKAMSPYLNGEVYQNMPDSTVPHALEAYYGSNLKRLMEIKAKYDPQNVFRFGQSIPLPSKGHLIKLKSEQN